MKPLLLLLIFLLKPDLNDATIVYICNSGKADKYHYDQKCRGLSNCTYKIKKSTVKKEKKDGKTLCKWED